MILTEPLPFAEAIAARTVRSLLPTELRSDLLETISPQVLERARFSAGVVDAEFLQRAFDGVDRIADGQTDRATQRADLKRLLDSMSYAAPAGEEGTIADLRTDARLNLILDTNVEMMQGAGRHLQGQDPAILDQWPAQELVRVRDSREPRPWLQIWRDAGGTVFPGDRMIALKFPADRIWERISRFGSPIPPFDFNSGMDVSDVDRDTAIDLGLIDRDTQIPPDDRDINQDLQATPQVRDASLKRELADQLSGVAEFVGNVLALIKHRDLRFTLNAFDPSQPRADDGEWSKTGSHLLGPRPRDFLGKRPAKGETHLPDDDNIARGRRAIEHLLNRKSGRIRGAMYDRELGAIEFAYGNTGRLAPNEQGVTHVGGGGIAHIDSKHHADLMHVPEWIVKGDKSRPAQWDDNLKLWKRTVTYKDKIVILTSRRPKSPSSWLVTGFSP